MAFSISSSPEMITAWEKYFGPDASALNVRGGGGHRIASGRPDLEDQQQVDLIKSNFEISTGDIFYEEHGNKW